MYTFTEKNDFFLFFIILFWILGMLRVNLVDLIIECDLILNNDLIIDPLVDCAELVTELIIQILTLFCILWVDFGISQTSVMLV